MKHPAKATPFVDQYLAFLLARTSHLVSEGFHAQLRKSGVPVVTWRTLAVLHDGACTVGELAERVLVNQPTMSKALDRLESEGLLRRVRAGSNRRSVRIELLAKGKSLVERLLPLAMAHQADAFAHLGAAERRTLVRVLQATIAHNRPD